MGTHRILLTDEAYARLEAAKRDDETYSDVITRLTRKAEMTDYFGAVSEATAEALDDVIVEEPGLDDVDAGAGPSADPEDRSE